MSVETDVKSQRRRSTSEDQRPRRRPLMTYLHPIQSSSFGRIAIFYSIYTIVELKVVDYSSVCSTLLPPVSRRWQHEAKATESNVFELSVVK